MIDPSVRAAWGDKTPRPRIIHGRRRKPCRRRLRITPRQLEYAKFQTLELGRPLKKVAAEIRVPYTTLRAAVLRPEYGYGQYRVGQYNQNSRHPDEVVEAIAWLFTLPECPKPKWVAHVFRMSRWSVWAYSKGVRQVAARGRRRSTPPEVVEAIRWLATLPECPAQKHIARVFRLTRTGVYNIVKGRRHAPRLPLQRAAG